MNCPCGKQITKNTFKRHLKIGICNLEQSIKNELIDTLELKTKHRWAWLKKEGKNAVNDTNWFWSIINKETTLDDWIFDTPRKLGENTPKQYEDSKTSRRGDNNPVNKVRLREIIFTKEEVLDYGRCLLYQLLEEKCAFGETFYNILQQEYPQWAYLFSNELLQASTGSSRFKILRLFFDGTDNELENILLKKRGELISIGQKKSKKFHKVASAIAANLGVWRITEPHKILFLLLNSIDTKCKIEVPFVNKSKTYSFDVYSPKIDGYIEMNGRFWHDNLNNKTGKVYGMVKHNLENDIVKRQAAINAGFNYWVFWDDEIAQWHKQIGEIYGTNPKITIEEAKNQINSVDWHAACIRYRSSKKS